MTLMGCFQLILFHDSMVPWEVSLPMELLGMEQEQQCLAQPPCPTYHVTAVQGLHSALQVPALGFSPDPLCRVLSCPSLAAKKHKKSPFCHLQDDSRKITGGKGEEGRQSWGSGPSSTDSPQGLTQQPASTGMVNSWDSAVGFKAPRLSSHPCAALSR